MHKQAVDYKKLPKENIRVLITSELQMFSMTKMGKYRAKALEMYKFYKSMDEKKFGKTILVKELEDFIKESGSKSKKK